MWRGGVCGKGGVCGRWYCEGGKCVEGDVCGHMCMSVPPHVHMCLCGMCMCDACICVSGGVVHVEGCGV